MDTIQVFGYIGALLVGIVLGLIGSGGSLMAIPIFTYLFHISPVTTTAYSLFVVGTSASIGALRNWNRGLINFRIAIVFAIPAFTGVYVVRKYILPIIPIEVFAIQDFVVTKDTAIMLLLAIIMLVSAISMVCRNKFSIARLTPNNLNYALIVLSGIVIGLVTGIVGIGGGFLIIPALVLLLKLPMKKAVATTLFIIAIKSLIGFLGDLGNLEINWSFLLSFTIVSTLGIFMGIYFSSYIKGENLKKSFGWLILILSIGIFYKEIFT
tara:strand:- start:17864 stop:18664 length:801 start_codon:yes stop_codon:yes gene_type:complete